ncbi:hypothetical protein IFR04_009998 [Cadophora malorum]|uniref:NmrA-like domain-containing protein n=1 Tax=Cadophora malorum TaxID=108018 RepID=A0A8H7TDI2_9HELO|nr:hypothetical protein IFR04_009998 [Cadophora malorum]
MPAKLEVVLVGASGATGVSIINTLLKEPEIFPSLAPALSTNQSGFDLAKRGIRVLAVDLLGPENDLFTALKGTQVVISTIFPLGTHQEQINLVNASHKAGVSRIVPGCWGPVVPPAGVLTMREEKEQIINHIKKIKLPYTIIDVGNWYQTNLPRVPSGKLDYMITEQMRYLSSEVDAKVAMSDIRDIGKQVAKIIVDERTLNKYVLAFSEILTQRELLDVVRKCTGEEPLVKEVTNAEVENLLSDAKDVSMSDPTNIVKAVQLAVLEYFYSWAIRGDTSIENAKYLGYLDTKELYGENPNLTSFNAFVDEIIQGKGVMLQTDYVNVHKQ